MDALIALASEIGRTRVSPWVLIDQDMIDRFADATRDHQFIHVDPVQAAQTPLGGTVAHGFLTLSLLPHLREQIDSPPVPGLKMGLNYGLDSVRFVSPVRSGNRVRAAFELEAVEEKRPGQIQQRVKCVVEIEGEEKPALVCSWIFLLFV